MIAKALPSLEIPAESAECLPAEIEDRNPPAHLKRLAEQARDYAKASSSANTQRAYASDWRHFESWSRRAGVEPRPDPQTIGLYLAACAEAASVRTIERRLSAIAWRFAQNGTPLDRRRSPYRDRCWPESAASMGGRRPRKKPSCRSI